MRRWSAADLQYDALHALWLSKGNAGEAEVALIQQHGEPWKASTLAQDTALGVTLTTAIIECRKDLARAHHALNSRGTKISMNALQRWYYAQFRRDTETIALSTAIDAEMDTDDGLEDHCPSAAPRRAARPTGARACTISVRRASRNPRGRMEMLSVPHSAHPRLR